MGLVLLFVRRARGKISVGPKSEEIEEGYVFFVGAMAELVLESTTEEMRRSLRRLRRFVSCRERRVQEKEMQSYEKL